MDTYISMYIKVDDETGHGQMRASVSKWNEAELVWNSQPYIEPTIVAPITTDQSTYPYLVSTLRNGTDVIVAALLERIARGEVFLMHQVDRSPIP